VLAFQIVGGDLKNSSVLEVAKKIPGKDFPEDF